MRDDDYMRYIYGPGVLAADVLSGKVRGPPNFVVYPFPLYIAH